MGKQALELRGCGFNVKPIELADSDYAEDRIFPITDSQGGGRGACKDRHLDLEVVKRNELHYFVVLPKR